MAIQARIVEGMHLVLAPPGATPPDSVPRDAVRCDLVESPSFSPRSQRVMTWLGAGLIAGSVVTFAWFGPWGMAPLLSGVALLGLGLGEVIETRLVPSAQGKYLAYETEPNEVGQLLGRGAALIMGTMIVCWVIADLLGEGPHEWWSLLPMAGFALTLLYFAVTGQDPRPEAEPPPSLRFRTMADASHPLSPAFRQPTVEGAGSARCELGPPGTSVPPSQSQPD